MFSRIFNVALAAIATTALVVGCSTPGADKAESSPTPVTAVPAVQETADWEMIDTASLTHLNVSPAPEAAVLEAQAARTDAINAAVWQEVDFASLPTAPKQETADWSVIDFTGFGS